jgi:hypothetical protein
MDKNITLQISGIKDNVALSIAIDRDGKQMG